jgi:glycosidase
VNSFTKEGRTKEQNDAFDFLKTLLNWRKNQDVIHSGNLTHFIPENNIYVYFRHNEKKKVMVVLNGDKTEKQLKLARYSELIGDSKSGRDVLTGKQYSLDVLTLPPAARLILELQ